MTAPKPVKPPLFSRSAWAFALTLLVGGGAVAGLSWRQAPARRLQVEVEPAGHARVRPAELAAWGLEGRRDYVVVDLRTEEAYRRGHIRGAVNCGTCHETKAEGQHAAEREGFVDLTKRLVLYTETGAEPVKLPKALASNPRLVLLEGGYGAWEREVMAPVTFGGEVDETEVFAKAKREAVRAFYAGERPTSAPVAPSPKPAIRREGAHAPAKPSEGC